MGYIKRKCNNCGAEYYVCPACERSGSWKVVCCSRNCFREYMKKQVKKVNNKNEKIETNAKDNESNNTDISVDDSKKEKVVRKRRKYTRKNGE